MIFKNETGENVKYRLGSIKSGFNWYTIRPEEIADIPEHIGVSLSLTEIKELVKEDGIEKAIDNSQDVDAGFPEEEDLVSLQAYFKKLVDIKGVGKISAEQIMFKYSSEDLLLQAIADGEEVHKHDGVDEAVKAEFK